MRIQPIDNQNSTAFRAVQDKYLKKAHDEYYYIGTISTTLMGMEVDHFQRKISNADMVDTLKKFLELGGDEFRAQIQSVLKKYEGKARF